MDDPKAANPYTEEDRYIYFFSDPHHLLKTARNAWANPKRPLWVSAYSVLKITCTIACITQCNGKEIAWSHLQQLYHMNRPKTDTPGLAVVHKLKYEQVNLTSFSKMRVDLAAQVGNYVQLLYVYHNSAGVKQHC